MTPSTAGGSAHPRRWTRARAAEIAFVVATLTAFVLLVAPTLGQPLLESHDFRQTQTAYTARIFHEEGIDLFHPKLPVLGDPFEVPFELPLFQAAAALVMDTGVGDDVAMRLTGLGCFLLTAFLLYGLVRHVAGTAGALAALLAFVAAPFAAQWSRTSMIEYLATAGAVGFAWATIAWRDSRRPVVGGLALVAGLVGMLVKPTTAVFWVLPALGYRPTTTTPGSRRRSALLLAGLVLVPVAATLVWTRHADEIKAASPTTAWLRSDALHEWTFGTMSQRLDLSVWGTIGARVVLGITGLVGLVLLCVSVIAIARSRQWLFWVGVALAGLLPPLVFTNLYVQHTYYLAAVTPAIAALVGLGAGFIWGRLPPQPHLRSVAAITGAFALVAGIVMLDTSPWRLIYEDDPPSETVSMAHELAAVTQRDDLVGVLGLDWSPALLYYADRRGLMVVDSVADPSLRLLARDGYRYIVVNQPSEADLAPLTRWSWLSAIAPHVYGVAESQADLPASPLTATDDLAALPRGRLVRRNVRVPCGEPVSVRGAGDGTQLHLAEAAPGARISLSDSYAPIPARRAILVGPELGQETLRVTCTGARSLTMDVRSAPSG